MLPIISNIITWFLRYAASNVNLITMHSKHKYLGFRQNSCGLLRTHLLVRKVSFLFISTGRKSVLIRHLINAETVKKRVIDKECLRPPSKLLIRELAADEFLL
jgi:hypothetical protein